MVIKILAGGLKSNASKNPVSMQPTPQSNIPQEDAPLLKDIGTAAAGLIPSAARGTVGSVGDLLSFVEKLPYQLGLGLANLATGGSVPTLGQLEKKFAGGSSPAAPLTTEQLPQLVKPVGPVSRFTSEVSEDIGGMIPWLLGGGLSPSEVTKKLARYGRAVAGGTGASRVAELFDVRPETAQLIKLGTTLGLAPMGMAKESKQYAANRFNRVEELAKDVNTSLPETEKKLIETYDSLKGRGFKDVDKLRDFIKNSLENFKEGKINLGRLTELYKDANTQYSGLQKLARPELEKIKSIISEGILNNEFAKKTPEFSKAFLDSNDIWRSLHTSGLVEDFKDRIKSTKGIATLFGTGIGSYISHLLGIPKIIAPAAAGLGLAGSETYKVGQFLKNSPAGRRLYAETMNDVFKSEISGFERNLSRLNKIYNKYEKQQEFKPTGQSGIRILSGGLRKD